MNHIDYRYPTQLNVGDKVKVYRNLHKSTKTHAVWSIVACSGAFKGRVIGHTSLLHLADVRPKISLAGRARVLREKKKYVHAYIVGTITKPVDCLLGQPIRYNPYESATFHWQNPCRYSGDYPHNSVFTGAQYCTLNGVGVYCFA